MTSDNRQSLEAAAEFWYRWSASAFLRAYRNAATAGDFLPATREEGATLLRVYLMEKAVYELSYELNNRPDWVAVPLAGLLSLTK
jgi:maltose alpha-D-glucosyltransferase/alpha-amylase